MSARWEKLPARARQRSIARTQQGKTGQQRQKERHWGQASLVSKFSCVDALQADTVLFGAVQDRDRVAVGHFDDFASTCDACGGAVKVIASIEEPAVIKQILAHLQRKAESKEFNPLPESGAPPQIGLLG